MGRSLKGSLIEVNHCRSLQTLTLLKRKLFIFTTLFKSQDLFSWPWFISFPLQNYRKNFFKVTLWIIDFFIPTCRLLIANTHTLLKASGLKRPLFMMLNSEIVDTVKDWQDTETLTLFCTSLGQIRGCLHPHPELLYIINYGHGYLNNLANKDCSWCLLFLHLLEDWYF